jgi:hypothetical protein
MRFEIGREGGWTSRSSNRRVTIFSFLEEGWVLGFDERASVCVYIIYWGRWRDSVL